MVVQGLQLEDIQENAFPVSPVEVVTTDADVRGKRFLRYTNSWIPSETATSTASTDGNRVTGDKSNPIAILIIMDVSTVFECWGCEHYLCTIIN